MSHIGSCVVVQVRASVRRMPVELILLRWGLFAIVVATAWVHDDHWHARRLIDRKAKSIWIIEWYVSRVWP